MSNTLNEIRNLVNQLEDICRENDIECWVDIYKVSKSSKSTYIDFDIEL